MTRYAILLALCMTLLYGCRTVKYVPAERTVTRTDTVHSAKLRVDSVIMRDSVAVFQKGDTVLITKYRDCYRVKELTDTVYQSAVDSVKVRVPYPVERHLTKWEQTKMDLGGVTIGCFLAVLSIAVIWLIKKFRK